MAYNDPYDPFDPYGDPYYDEFDDYGYGGTNYLSGMFGGSGLSWWEEEERKRREEEARRLGKEPVQTETTKTLADGTVETTLKTTEEPIFKSPDDMMLETVEVPRAPTPEELERERQAREAAKAGGLASPLQPVAPAQATPSITERAEGAPSWEEVQRKISEAAAVRPPMEPVVPVVPAAPAQAPRAAAPAAPARPVAPPTIMGRQAAPGSVVDLAARAGRALGITDGGAPAQAAPAAGPTQDQVRQLWERYNQTGNPADFERANQAMQAMERAQVQPAGVQPSGAVTTPVSAPATPAGRELPPAGAPTATPTAIEGPPGSMSAYNQYINQNESGKSGAFDFKYHNRNKSSAYGMFGITRGTYDMIARLDPYFAGKPITSLTREEQIRANNVLTNHNNAQLDRAGYAPSEGFNTSALAHFAGSRGAIDYLRTRNSDGTGGYISPEAARANGGYDQTRRIMEGRLRNAPAPSSGAAEPTAVATTPGAQTVPGADQLGIGEAVTTGSFGAPITNGVTEIPKVELQPGATTIPAYGPGSPGANRAASLQRFQEVQNDPSGLTAFIKNPEVPDDIKDLALKRLQGQATKIKAEAKAQEMVAKGDTKAIQKVVTGKPKDEEGSWLKLYFLHRLGGMALAKGEAIKLGLLPDQYTTATFKDPKTGQDVTAQVKVRADGKILEGMSIGGMQLNQEQLALAAKGVGAGDWTTSGTIMQAADGTMVRLQTNKKGESRYVKAEGGTWTGDPKTLKKLEEAGAMRRMDRGLVVDLAKKHGQNVLEAEKEYVGLNGPFRSPEERQQFRDAYGFGLATPAPVPGVAQTGTPPVAAPGAVTTAPATTPVAPGAVAVPPAGAPAPVAGVERRPVEPVAPGAVAAPPAVAPGAPPQVAPGALPQVAPAPELIRPIEGQKQEKVVSQKEQEQFVTKTKPEIGEAATNGQFVAQARRQQLDLIKSNPAIVNIMNGTGTGYDKAKNVIIRAMSGAYGSEEKEQLYKDIKATGLGEAEIGALQEFLNINTTINAKTLRMNSGGGSVSDAEQRANKEANIGNIDRIPVYAALAGLHRSGFAGDLNGSKQQFMAANPQLRTTTEFNSAWQKQEALLLKQYQAIAKSRFDVMGKAPAANADAAALAAYRDRVFRAFEAYPAPTFNYESGKWDYGTANAKRAAMSAILGR